jgi:hypothetical protein
VVRDPQRLGLREGDEVLQAGQPARTGEHERREDPEVQEVSACCLVVVAVRAVRCYRLCGLWLWGGCTWMLAGVCIACIVLKHGQFTSAKSHRIRPDLQYRLVYGIVFS